MFDTNSFNYNTRLFWKKNVSKESTNLLESAKEIGVTLSGDEEKVFRMFDVMEEREQNLRLVHEVRGEIIVNVDYKYKH